MPHFFPNELNRPPSKLDPMPPSAPNPPVAPIRPVTNGISVARVEPDAGMVDAAPAAAPTVGAAAAVLAPRLNGRLRAPNACSSVTMPSAPVESCTLGRDNTG